MKIKSRRRKIKTILAELNKTILERMNEFYDLVEQAKNLDVGSEEASAVLAQMYHLAVDLQVCADAIEKQRPDLKQLMDILIENKKE